MVKNFRSSIYLVPIFLVSAVTAHSQITPELKTVEESQIDSIFTEWNISDGPGGAVAVLIDDELVFTKEYGLADLEHNIPITKETRFHIASVSKQFTAYAIALLIAKDALSLDDEIQNYLPDLNHYEGPITIRNLIYHTAGFRQAMRLMAIEGTRNDQLLTQEKLKKLIWNQRELNFYPGTEYSYSNSNYILLATIVERVTGEPFPEWMQEHVFKPLGMTQTIIVNEYNKIVENRAKPYRKTKEGYEQHRGLFWLHYGGNGIYTTIGDMAKWLAHLNQPDARQNEIISQMHTKGVLANGDTINYAFGLNISLLLGQWSHIWHVGDGDGYRAYAGRVPEAGLGIIVFTNVVPSNPYSKAMEIADLYLKGREAKDNENKSTDHGQEMEIELDSLKLDKLVGEYLLQDKNVPYKYESFNISLHDGKLKLSGSGSAVLVPASDTTFKAIYAPVTFTFHQNAMGKVDKMTIHTEEGDLKTNRVESSNFSLGIEKLKEYTGPYFSSELETEYYIFLKGSTLYVSHEAYPDFKLEPVMPDAFKAEFSFFRWVGFSRNEEGKITGFRVTNSNERVRNLRFKRIKK